MAVIKGSAVLQALRKIKFMPQKAAKIIATKKIAQLQTRKIDLMKIKTESDVIFSFNVAGWGMPPDINILAEKMRWLGLQRYNIASLIEIMRFKKRPCDLIINDENIAIPFQL